VGYGVHEKPGQGHAEVIALRQAGERAKGATIYSSLEPCCHHGRTPPCTDAILKSGVSRVVYGERDQNPLVNGKGAETLQRAGIPVDKISSASLKKFYRPYSETFQNNKPYVIAKVGMTANGIISPADRNSRWITNETSLAWVHYLRAQCDAILIGADTALLDRPHLTVRIDGMIRKPLRIIVDSRFKLLPEDCSLLDSDVPILVCGSELAPSRKEEAWKEKGVRTIRFRNMQDLLTNLFELGIRKILVEGGQKIFTLFHTAGVIDEYILMVAPRLITGKHFLNVLGGPEQSLSETTRLFTSQPIQLDGDVVLRLRKS
jgi:diaminohydroxyphosphoribosylaminopyrimidine deaminase/5-amino-6-(5-phosphoribosylamino)uracil reductase